uniref:site-2 protease family protein n=1 Tax=Ruminococcus sp. TaxID=41978 RepID=UPI0025EAC356
MCHECAHGWVSYKLGDPTAKNAGRLSLNPIKHLDPIGALCMLFFHVGWAKPVPIDPSYYKDKKKGIIYVSLAGPAANFILAFISLFIEGIIIKFADTQNTLPWIFAQLCYYSAVINIGLGLFNLIPIPPLDGSKVLGCTSKRVMNVYIKYERYWQIVLILCVVTGVLSKPLGYANSFMLNAIAKLIGTILGI